MSTKTLRKRIALVAVSALGFGLLATAPASAATTARTATANVSNGTLQAGVSGTLCTITLSAAFDASEADTLEISAVTGPIGGVVTWTSVGGTALTANTTTVGGSAENLVADTAGTDGSATAAIVGSASKPGVYNFDWAGAGTCTVTITASTSGTTALVATQSASAGVAAAANTVTLTRSGASAADTDGQVLGQFTASADYTDAPLTTVFGKVTSTTDLAAVTVGGSEATKTFAIARTNLAAGSYTVRFWVDVNANQLYESSELSTTATFTVAGAASAIAVSLDKAGRSNVSGHQTFTVTATVTDADGNGSAATLYISETTTAGVDESLSYTNIVDDTPLARVGTSNTYVGTFAVDTSAIADVTTTGITVADATDLTSTATIKGTATLSVYTFGALDATAGTAVITANDAVGIGSYTSGVRQTRTGSVATDGALTVDTAITTITYTGLATAGDEGEYVFASHAPSAATTCATSGSSYVKVLADLSFTYTIAATCIAAEAYTVTFTGTNEAAIVTTFAAPTYTWTTSPGASFKAVNGSTNSIVGILADQFNRAQASKAVTATVTGRNPSTTALTTNAAGQVTWTGTDTSTSTLLLTDSVVFNYNYTGPAGTNVAVASTARVITFAATAVAVGTIVLVDNNSGNSQAIDQAESTPGVPAAYTTYTATLKTSTGAPVTSGVLVTFAGGANDKFVAGNVGVTDTAGQATVTVYRQKTGYAAITATANGVSSNTNGDVEWVNTDAAARYVSVSAPSSVVAGGVGTVVATVTDRWGNAIQTGVTVTFGLTGNGRILTNAAGTTNIYGQDQIQVTSNAAETGVMTITATITGNQSADAAGYVGTAVVAGVTAGDKSPKTTTVTFTKDTSTSTADALLALAQALGTRDQASATVDAAAEATDAANAATDAANAAAEAADAATAAAQDASDAVAALSAQVSEAIAGLKKQLVSLTNLVIKIQKKVNA